MDTVTFKWQDLLTLAMKLSFYYTAGQFKLLLYGPVVNGQIPEYEIFAIDMIE